MDVGEPVSVMIAASQHWNDTKIDLVSGEEYHFRANGEWTDWYIRCDAADGFESVGFRQRKIDFAFGRLVLSIPKSRST
jgi:hypothetical protein